MYFVSGLKEEIAYLDLLMEYLHVLQPANPMSVLFASLGPWSVVIVLKCSLKKWFFEVLWNTEVCPKLGAYLCCSLLQGAAVCTSLGNSLQKAVTQQQVLLHPMLCFGKRHSLVTSPLHGCLKAAYVWPAFSPSFSFLASVQNPLFNEFSPDQFSRIKQA